jgi:malate synthase
MAAFIPSRRDAQVNETALAKVREDKVREASDGFDGTWVAHPDLVPVAMEMFDAALKDRPHQKDRLREEVNISAEDLRNIHVPGGTITEAGVRNNISVALQYLESWLRGTGAVAIFNLMEDAATAEISRAQLWQWIHHKARLDAATDGGDHTSNVPITAERYKRIQTEEISKLESGDDRKYAEAAEILDRLVLNEDFIDFLTLPAYNYLH